jgi:hypothetical protein
VDVGSAARALAGIETATHRPIESEASRRIASWTSERCDYFIV